MEGEREREREREREDKERQREDNERQKNQSQRLKFCPFSILFLSGEKKKDFIYCADNHENRITSM